MRGSEAFTLWGQLDPTAERQAVLVSQITETIDGEQDFEGVSVVSVDHTTGVETIWRDSLVQFGDGTAHVFVADIRPAYGSRLEVQVRRDGQVATYARTTVPPRVEPYFEAIMPTADSFVDLFAIGAPRLAGGAVDYVVFPEVNPADVTVETFRIEQQVQSIDVGWKARLPLSVHGTDVVSAVNDRYPDNLIRTVIACQIYFRVSVVDEDWAPPFPMLFSRELLIQPGTLSNVRNGFGYVGAGYTLELPLELTDQELSRIGLQPRVKDPCLAAGY